MTTDRGGWTLVYRIRNDIPDIVEPWFPMVNLGAGTAFPTSPTALPSGTHFDGPPREIRYDYTWRARGQRTWVEVRATVLRASDGMPLFDVRTKEGGTINVFATGLPVAWQGMGSTMGDHPAVVIGTSAGLPPVGTHGDELTQTGMDVGSWSDGTTSYPLLGDATVGALRPAFTDSTTLFWVRAPATN
jgi:hypothetical protein